MALFLEQALSAPLSQVLPHVQERIMSRTRYFGIKTLKNPLDFWVYQELLFEQQPDLVVEIGNRFGGSTLALAHFLDLLEHGRVIGVDIDQSKIPGLVRAHPRIRLIEDDAGAAYPRVLELVEPGEKVLVIEDSAHTFDNTLAVLRSYSQLLQPGGYLIVEDTICHHGLEVGPDPGPWEAVQQFLTERTDFETDRERESFVITWNPTGFLRRKV